ncbi:RNA polymerase sigma factor [Spirosoma radiotolerans]|uniref:RNA polymerase sigma factor n=1 Tax=Spirosoma radiotolerans TaxID=1379870 RepID=A0A0E3ZRJ2_9BACT|nr:DUF6596 domain-containing protein [Spirosoma radiotolerans]AKD53669.1 RNA polymerase sigma factor [Spirosoma radiotolerans]
MTPADLIPHLFRSEFSKICAVLSKTVGVDNLDSIEDIVSDTFLLALATWPYKGKPENPTAWLYTVAKNKTKNHLKRQALFRQKISGELQLITSTVDELPIDFSDQSIVDSQLQLFFAICHPSIPVEAQVSLALRILCGFGIDEIANALLSTKETIHKRLYRAKAKLKAEKVTLQLPPESQIESRLETVLTTLYLLYNEGYYSESQDAILRLELCQEAMRLTNSLIATPRTSLPAVKALYALMCFHGSRFAARKTETGQFILLQDQDPTRWDDELISRGAYYLHEASQGESVSRFHLEASIAYWHTLKEDTPEKWKHILFLYDRLLQLVYSPIAALNRLVAVSKVYGNRQAIEEAKQLNLSTNHFYHVLLGELYTGTDNAAAQASYHQAFLWAKTETDKQTIRQKLNSF